jgi:hypothetical protein
LIDRKERKKNRTSRIGFVTGENPIPERAPDGSPPRTSPAEPGRIPWSATVGGGRGVLLGGAARGSREEEREKGRRDKDWRGVFPIFCGRFCK